MAKMAKISSGGDAVDNQVNVRGINPYRQGTWYDMEVLAQFGDK